MTTEGSLNTYSPSTTSRGGAPKPAGSSARHWWLLLAAAVSCIAGAAPSRPGAEPKSPQSYQFSGATVLDMARRLSESSYAPPRIAQDSPLRQLSYDEFRQIGVRTDNVVWRLEQVPFRIQLLPAGFLYTLPVRVAVVENRMARELVPGPQHFQLDPKIHKALANIAIPASGFRVQTRLNSRSVWDEFLVFQGASYFRAVPRDNFYGLSARGLALRTAHPMGEEFPEFTHFWVERPSANAAGIVVHALLDSPSTTGAYKFSIVPGNETIVEVDMTLFPRVALDNVGIGTLTSMFMFDESERTRIDDFRDEVHDSDGLQVVMATGERVWRPLRNPTQLQVSSFTNEAPRGFGLVQRSRRLSDYHDLQAHYHKRPSAWVEPTSDWGAGSVQLIEIPTDRETNDNIVAMWKPKDPIPAGKPWRTTYRIRWNEQPRLPPGVGVVTATRSGPSFDGRRRLFVVDFRGAGRNIEGLRIDVGASAGKVSNPVLQPNPLTKGIRASFELDPADAPVVELRMRVVRGERPVTETWLYRWTAT